MQYTFSVTVPPNTPQAAPARWTVELTAGEIRQVTVFIPPGHHGLAGIRFLVRDQVIIPSSPDAWLRGDDVLLTFPEKLPLLDVPPRLGIEAYNEDGTFPHTFELTVTILEPEFMWEEILGQLSVIAEQFAKERTVRGMATLVRHVAEIKQELLNLRRVDMEAITQALAMMLERELHRAQEVPWS